MRRYRYSQIESGTAFGYKGHYTASNMRQNADCSPSRLVLYTDDAVLAVGALHVLSSLQQFRVLGAETVLSSLVPFVERVRPDVIVVDLTPEITLGLVSVLRNAAPEARLILWGRSLSEELRYQARQIGVAGFLEHGITAEQFANDLKDLTRGDGLPAAQNPDHLTTVPLTNRESQLVELLSQLESMLAVHRSRRTA